VVEQFEQVQKVDGRFKFGGGIEDYAKRFEQD
jgi:hypothetical protein